MTTTAPFDRIANAYDTLWTHSEAGRAQRDAVWRVIDGLFQTGDEILDIGCGTGEDAVHLGRNGVHVSAIDASAEMVKIASARGVSATQLAVEQLNRIHGRYDGVLSNFGALNCTADLATVADSLHRLLRPRRYVAVCLLNRVCAWEIAWFGAQLRARAAFRRLKRTGVTASLGVHVAYPSARDVCQAFAAGFELVRSVGIGVFVPPSFVALPPGAIHRAARLDARFGGCHIVRALGDHRLYIFRRRQVC